MASLPSTTRPILEGSITVCPFFSRRHVRPSLSMFMLTLSCPSGERSSCCCAFVAVVAGAICRCAAQVVAHRQSMATATAAFLSVCVISRLLIVCLIPFRSVRIMSRCHPGISPAAFAALSSMASAFSCFITCLVWLPARPRIRLWFRSLRFTASAVAFPESMMCCT